MSSRLSDTWLASWGAQIDKLNHDNYDTWVPLMRRHLESNNWFGFIDGSRTSPESIRQPANTPYGDLLVAKEHLDAYNTNVAKVSAAIFNACSLPIQERYLKEISRLNPKAMWDLLQEKMEGDDQDLNAKFHATLKAPTESFTEFIYKLKDIQKRLSSMQDLENKKAAARVTAGEADAVPMVISTITDRRMKEHILNNAGIKYCGITSYLNGNKLSSLADVIEAYVTAEEQEKKAERLAAIATPKIHPSAVAQADNSVAAYVVQQNGSGSNSQPTSRESLPSCPSNWNGSGCWHHTNSSNHNAVDCEALKFLQTRYFTSNNIEPYQLQGFSHPRAVPRPNPKGKNGNKKNGRAINNSSGLPSPSPSPPMAQVQPVYQAFNPQLGQYASYPPYPQFAQYPGAYGYPQMAYTQPPQPAAPAFSPAPSNQLKRSNPSSDGCKLCLKPDHETNNCPELGSAAASIHKKARTGSALVSQVAVPDATPEEEGQVAPR